MGQAGPFSGAHSPRGRYDPEARVSVMTLKPGSVASSPGRRCGGICRVWPVCQPAPRDATFQLAGVDLLARGRQLRWLLKRGVLRVGIRCCPRLRKPLERKAGECHHGWHGGRKKRRHWSIRWLCLLHSSASCPQLRSSSPRPCQGFPHDIFEEAGSEEVQVQACCALQRMATRRAAARVRLGAAGVSPVLM